MAVRLVAVLVVAAVFAGCSGGEGGSPTQSFDDLKGSASTTTGVLRGVVVDDRIVPVSSATITLRGTASVPDQTTDAQGRFLFSDLLAGTYFIEVRSAVHKTIQSSGEVVAGVAEPAILRIQLERLFTQDPFPVQVVHEGYFQCSQSGASVWYSSSTCVDGIAGPVSDIYPPVSNTTQQEREWHADVGPGWQVIVYEMEWEPTSDSTSTRMGMVISTYKPERAGSHWFAEFEGSTPIRGQIDVGVEHESASGVDPSKIPEEGLQDMSFFVSVRGEDFTPGISLNQQFKVYVTMFHYGRPPEGWSFLNGDPMPF